MENKPAITISGKVLKLPEMRFTAQGDPITTFSVALYTGGNKEKGYEPSLFVRVSCWNELAEIANSIPKMSVVKVSGTPKPKRMYTNKDGVEVQADLEITANKIEVDLRIKADEETERQVEAHSHGSPDVDF